MKKILLIIVFFSGIILNAQVPEYLNYQAVVRNTAGEPITNQLVSFWFTIYKTSPSGTNVYSEKHSPTTNGFGLVTLNIGNGSETTGDFASIDWGADNYFLNVQIDPAGGSTYTDMGTTQLLSVPYAMHSKSAATAADAVKLTGDQVITGNKTFSGTTTVATPVNATDAATKAYVDNVLKELGLIPNNYSGTVSDIDGNAYKTVTIGTQTWMSENLRVVRYKNGSVIPLVTDNTAWSNLLTPGYCWYNKDESTYKATYGALYNWYTVSTGNLCPTGWHIPSDIEWKTLEMYLGMTQEQADDDGLRGTIEGGKLKETGTTDWTSPNTGATNESGFTALPGGCRFTNGFFDYVGIDGYGWSATEFDATLAWLRTLYFNNSGSSRNSFYKTNGFSVRCIKD